MQCLIDTLPIGCAQSTHNIRPSASDHIPMLSTVKDIGDVKHLSKLLISPQTLSLGQLNPMIREGIQFLHGELHE